MDYIGRGPHFHIVVLNVLRPHSAQLGQVLVQHNPSTVLFIVGDVDLGRQKLKFHFFKLTLWRAGGFFPELLFHEGQRKNSYIAVCNKSFFVV
jgi:hypothetical protein